MGTDYEVVLEDANGTLYCAEHSYFDDLDQARLYAKSQLSEEIVCVKITTDRGDVVDFFQRTV